MKLFITQFLSALVLSLAMARPVEAQVIACDDAGNGVGTSSQSWTNGMNTGFGWSTPWILLQTVRDNTHQVYAGFYNGNGSRIATTNNSSWGMYANGNWNAQTPLYNGTNKAVALRGFSSLTTNQVFEIQWQCKGVAAGGTANNRGGFSLRNGMVTTSYLDYDTGARFAFYYPGGGSSFLIRDGNGINPTGIPLASAGFNCEFTLEPNDSYRFVVRNPTNNATLYIADGQPLSGLGTIDSISLYDLQCQDGDQNFNRMQIVSAASVAPVIFNIQPADGSAFVDPHTNISFEVNSLGQNLSGANVSLVLNGAPQVLSFNTNGTTGQLWVTNTTPLATNVQYGAAIIAADGSGNRVTNIFGFNTITTNSLWRDVNNFGAAGDGATMDTAAIQSAINACPAGGYVWLHGGTYLSGTIYLKSAMTLYIDPTATLLGSGSVADYPTLTPALSNSQSHNCQKALVYAESCTNVTITGGGTVNGNGRANFRSGVEATRPIAIWTALCQQVNIENISIVDASMWTMVNMQSDYLTISNVSINDDGLNGNRDGCDVVDCWHVVIENCTIDSGDDSICLKSGNARGINDLLVKNCTITKSQSNGLKFGTASKGVFTHITFQDCTVLNTAHSAMAVESVDGGSISDVTFQRINFSSCQNGIFIVLGSRSSAGVGSIDGITFRDITGRGMTDTRGCPIVGCLTNGITYNVKNILFDNVSIAFAGGVGSVPATPAEYAGQYPENTIWGNLPAYGYYIRHAINVTFTNCYTSASVADARPWMNTNDVSNLKVIGPVLNIVHAPANAVLQWNNGYTLQTSTNLSGTYTDLVGASSLYTNRLTNSPQRFFRLRQ